MARLLPQRQFEKGTRTKQVRFWVREDEWLALVQRALDGPLSMSKLVVDSVLSEHAKMTSADARRLVEQLIGVRGEMGRCVLALHRVHAKVDAPLAEEIIAQLRLLNAQLYNITEDFKL